ncbi:hypothetical protein THAR02_11245 [Trichoderma harzianum]|uniref:Uncharacterized protein n=1 Tax=Trichoderma harzianum TaxID=5544 RepID=A0A0F9WU11_TRIHA|nr:hypothetical protein THAR02_11245 [Trichoderma harzianum]
MYKRKFESNLAVACKKAKMDCPNITPNHCEHTIQAAPTTLPTPIVPELLKKRKRSEECEAEASGDREARRSKSSHSGSNRLRYPHSLSPASKYQIFPKTEDNSEKESLGGFGQYWEGRVAPRGSTPDDNPTSAAKDTTITTDVVLLIRLARPRAAQPSLPNSLQKERGSKKQVRKKAN